MNSKFKTTGSSSDPHATDQNNDELYKPKAGPGQIIKREIVPVPGSGRGGFKRYRNIGTTPLRAAFHRNQLHSTEELQNRLPGGAISAQERLDYGEKFEGWWYTLMGSTTRDSTMPSVSGGRGSRSITEKQQIAGEQIARLRTRMSSRNYLIVEAFCGYGHTMVDSLRCAGVEAHPVGTAFRVREALDDLVCVLTGRTPVPLLVR